MGRLLWTAMVAGALGLMLAGTAEAQTPGGGGRPGGGGGGGAGGGGAGGAQRPAAQRIRQAVRQFFAQHDANKDQKIELSEFPGTPTEFAAIDKDGDTFITPREYGEHLLGRAQTHAVNQLVRAYFQRHDANKDRLIQRTEYPKSDAEFDALDTDNSDTLSPAEVEVGIQNRTI